MKYIKHFILSVVLFFMVVGCNINILNAYNQNESPDVYERLEREIVKHREASRKAVVYTHVFSFVGLLIVVFTIYAVVQWRKTQRQNHILAQHITKTENIKKKAAAINPAKLSDEDLYVYLREIIEREELYLNPNFERQSLMKRTGLSKERIGAAFAHGSKDERLTTLVRELRLKYAVRLMNEQPDLTIEKVCLQSGFTNPDTFTRNFKAKYGMTPSAFQQSKA